MSRGHLAAATALCLALALPSLTGDLYGDERGHTLRYVAAGSWADLALDPALVHPPLYLALARAAVAAVGAPWAMRLPSLLAALLLVPAAAAAARRVLGPRLAAPAAWAAAASPFALEFATEGRAYALVLLWSTLALCAFLDFLERETPRRAAALAAALAAGALTHFGFLLQAAFLGGWYLWRRRGVTPAALAVGAAVALAVAPFAVVQGRIGVEGLAGMLQGSWSAGVPEAANLLGRLAVALVYGYNLFLLGPLDPARTVGLGQLRANLPLLAAVGLVFAALAAALARARRERGPALALCAAGIAVPAALALGGAALGWYLVREKHLAVTWVFALLLVVAGLAELWERRRWRAVVAVHGALVALALFNATARADRYSRRSDWTGLGAVLRAELREGDRVLSYALPAAALGGGKVPLAAGDRRETVLGAAGAGGGPAAAAAAVAAETPGRVFLVYDETGRNLVDPGDGVIAALAARRDCEVRHFGRNVALHLCARPGEGGERR